MHQPAADDRLDPRDLILRVLGVVGLVGTAFALLIAIFPS